MLRKMGYNGGGLGKEGDGIISPIKVNARTFKIPVKIPVSRVNNDVHTWPTNTTLITGSSILSGLQENRLKKYRAKVRMFPGAVIDDMFDYLTPLLKKKPTNIILHIGSNDAIHKSDVEIIDEINNLKRHIENTLPEIKVFLSCPVIRTDNTRANLTLRKVDKYFKSLPYIVKNDNVDSTCLGKMGLHLNRKGSDRLAINYISLMRRL